MHARDIVHVAADARVAILGGDLDLRAAGVAIAGRLEIQADVEPRKELRRRIRSRRLHHLRLGHARP